MRIIAMIVTIAAFVVAIADPATITASFGTRRALWSPVGALVGPTTHLVFRGSAFSDAAWSQAPVDLAQLFTLPGRVIVVQEPGAGQERPVGRERPSHLAGAIARYVPGTCMKAEALSFTPMVAFPGQPVRAFPSITLAQAGSGAPSRQLLAGLPLGFDRAGLCTASRCQAIAIWVKARPVPCHG